MNYLIWYELHFIEREQIISVIINFYIEYGHTVRLEMESGDRYIPRLHQAVRCFLIHPAK